MEAVIKNEELYEKYVDSLMLIHDLICEFSANQGQPRLTSKEDIENQIQQLLEEPLMKDYHKISENVRTNYEVAQTIRQLGEQSQTADRVFAVEEKASLFLNFLLRIYRTLRTSGGRVALE